MFSSVPRGKARYVAIYLTTHYLTFMKAFSKSNLETLVHINEENSGKSWDVTQCNWLDNVQGGRDWHLAASWRAQKCPQTLTRGGAVRWCCILPTSHHWILNFALEIGHSPVIVIISYLRCIPFSPSCPWWKSFQKCFVWWNWRYYMKNINQHNCIIMRCYLHLWCYNIVPTVL